MSFMSTLIKQTETSITSKIETIQSTTQQLKEEVKKADKRAQDAGAAASEAKEAIRSLEQQFKDFRASSGGSSSTNTNNMTQQPGADPRSSSTNDEWKIKGKGKGKGADAGKDDEGRMREIRVGGFEVMKRSDLEEALIEIMNNSTAKDQYEDAYAPYAMGGLGVVRFKSEGDKKSFLQTVYSKKAELKFKGRDLWVSDNNADRASRIRGRAISKVKRALMEAKPERQDVTIDRRTGEAWVGTSRVAKWDGERMRLTGEGLTLKTRIEELIDEKPQKNDDLSD